jgi:hypothetical protein
MVRCYVSWRTASCHRRQRSVPAAQPLGVWFESAPKLLTFRLGRSPHRDPDQP